MYSQNEEEKVITDFFNQKDPSSCNFIDIGANDGKTFSNTRKLAELGWKGVLVDASPRAFARLKELYRGKHGYYTYNLALTSYDGRIKLNESDNLCSNDDIGLVSTIVADEMQRFSSITKYKQVDVACFTWSTFYGAIPGKKKFEFISIDIEGAELFVLPEMDLNEMGTELICLEWNGKQDIRNQYESILKELNFGSVKCIHVNGENVIYAR